MGESEPHFYNLDRICDILPSPLSKEEYGWLLYQLPRTAHQLETGRASTPQLTSTSRFVTFTLMLFLSSVKLSRIANGAVGS